MSSKRPVEHGSSPATRKKQRRSIMKSVKVNIEEKDETSSQDFKAARKSRVSFGHNMIQVFKRDESSDASSINCTTTAEVTRTIPVKAPTPPPPPVEENKENLTLNIFSDDVEAELPGNSLADSYGEFSFEQSLTEPSTKDTNSINTRGMFTMTQKVPTPEVPTRELTMDLLPPITPQSTKKKRRSLLETVQMNNFTRQNSPKPSTPTGPVKNKRKSFLLSPKQAAKVGSIFKLMDEDSDDDVEEKTTVVSLESAADRSIQDKTINVAEKTMNMTVAEHTSAKSVTACLENLRLKRPNLEPEKSQPVELTNDDIVRMRNEFTKLEKAVPSTPSTPIVVKADLRRKLMKSRSSIGLARGKKLAIFRDEQPTEESLVMPTEVVEKSQAEESLIMPFTPARETPATTRAQHATVERHKQMSILRNSPLTRNNSRRLKELEKVDKTVNFTSKLTQKVTIPEPEVTKNLAEEMMIDSVTMEQEPVNDSLMSMNFSLSKQVDLTDALSTPEPFEKTEWEEVTCDPATKLISPHVSVTQSKTMNLDQFDDSFDYAREMKSMRVDTLPLKTPTPTPIEAKVNEKNENYLRFRQEVESTFDNGINLQQLCLIETDQTPPDCENRVDRAVFYNLTMQEVKMNEVFIKRLASKVADAKPSGYQLELLNNLTEKAVQALDLEKLEPKARTMAEIMFLKEITKMKTALLETGAMEKLAASVRKTVPDEEKITKELEKLKVTNETLNSQIQTIKQKIDSGVAASICIDEVKEVNAQKTQKLAALQAEIKRLQHENSVAENSKKSKEAKMAELSKKFGVIFDKDLIYCANGVVVFDTSASKFRLVKQFRIVPLPKWVWLLGPKRFYEPFRRLTSVTMENLISQLNLKVGNVKFEFLLQKLNEAWKTLENIVKGFLCALASTGTNVEMMGQLNEKHFEIEANVRILRVGMQKSESGKVKWSFGVKDCQIYLESVQLLPFSLGEFEFRDRFSEARAAEICPILENLPLDDVNMFNNTLGKII